MYDFFVFTFTQCLGETPSKVFWHKTIDKRIETAETELFVEHWEIEWAQVTIPIDISEEATECFDMFHGAEHLQPNNIKGLEDLENFNLEDFWDDEKLLQI